MIFIFIGGLLSACGIFNPEEQDIEPCPWNPEGVGHWITLPITVTPHKKVYKVGDTLRFSFHESIMVRDSNMKRRFDLSGFPFRPVHSLWRFEENSTDIFFPFEKSSFSNIEQRFRPEIVGDSRGKGISMWAITEQDSFLAYTDIILESPGKFISAWWDVYSATLEGSGGDRSYAEPIEFEGKCQNHSLLIRHNLVGDDHLSEFIPELIQIDSLFSNQLYFTGAEWGTDLDRGSTNVRQNAYFGFEVVE